LLASGNYLIAGSFSGIYRSKNNGTSWSANNQGLTNFRISTCTACGNKIFVGTDAGAFVSGDTGTTWTPINSGLYNNHVHSLLGIGNVIFAGMQQGGVFYSSDNGATWNSFASGPIDSSGANPIVHCLGINGKDLFAGTSGGVYRYDSNNKGWASTDTELHALVLSQPEVVSLTASGGNLLAASISTYLVSGGGSASMQVNLSSNNGKSWSPVLSKGMASTCVLTTNGNSCYAITSYFYLHGTKLSQVYRSNDNGTTWANVCNLGIPIISVIAFNNFLYAGTTSDLNTGTAAKGALRSSDNGTTWNPYNVGLPENTSVFSFAVSGNVIFAGTSSGVYIVETNSWLWIPFNDGLPNLKIGSLAVTDKNIFAAATDDVVWQHPLSNNSVRKGREIDDHRFTFDVIQAGHRDHFVAITYSLPKSEHISITINNLLGHEIARIIEKKMNAGGHRYLWNTSGLAPGCYTIKIKTDTNIAIKRITLF
jgi:hypothetical protein